MLWTCLTLSWANSMKPRVIVIGPLPAQAEQIARTYPQLDIVCFTTGRHQLGKQLQGSDLVIGMTNFMRHSTDGAAYASVGSAYKRTTGSISSVKRIINSWLENEYATA